jgi:ubiquinone/menaquinone biosynthesis C-methylase UbiE
VTLSDKAKYKPTERFSGLATRYALGRPSYPKTAIDFIIEHCHLQEGDTVADIGCGTGISSLLFAQRHMLVTGIEPNEDMRQQAIKELLNLIDSIYPNPQYLSGAAEKTGLRESSVNLVVCAQSFHWFDPDKALAEFHRILKPKGWVALMWNERDESDTFTHEYSQLIRTVPNAANLEMKRCQAGEIVLQYPSFSHSEKLLFPNKQSVDEDGLLDRAFSTSYAPKDLEIAGRLSDQLKALFGRYQIGGRVSLIYTTSVYLAQGKGI